MFWAKSVLKTVWSVILFTEEPDVAALVISNNLWKEMEVSVATWIFVIFSVEYVKWNVNRIVLVD